MSELLISEYEKQKKTDKRVERRMYFIQVLLLMALLTLITNQILTQSLVVQAGINVITFVLICVIFFCPCKSVERDGGDMEKYAEDIKCMEKILYHLEIDNYNKLGLVMDGVKERLDSEESERRRREKISVLSILALAGMFSLLFLNRQQGGLTCIHWGSLLNSFLVLAVILAAWVYVASGLYSSSGKYRRLYELLWNVMIIKY